MNKGYNFESSEVDVWRKFLIGLGIPTDKVEELVFRVIGSGMNKLATKTGGTILEGDVSVELAKLTILPKDILIECKHHKSHTIERSVSVKKEWVDQALHEAEKNGRLALVAIKFKGVAPNSTELKKYCWADGHFGNSIHYIIPQHHFFELTSYIAGIKSKQTVDLVDVSTDELLAELKRRLEKKG